MTKTVFEKIIDGELPCNKVYENSDVIAFKDIHPQAPVHILIVPKKKIACIQEMRPEDYHYLTKIVSAAQEIAKEFNVEDNYRLLTNNGSEAGQTIFYLHFHLLGGRVLGALG